MVSEKQTIWIDCDPGADDALGILILAASDIKIGGIVSCFGNGSSEATALNATKVLRLANRQNISVYQGAARPLIREFTPSILYCGNDGLCDTGLVADPDLLKETDFSVDLIQSVQETGEKVTWLVTGALTNLARFIQNHSEPQNYIDKIITVSGCFGLTEYAKRAEWNIEIDPDAAKIVYESNLPIQAIGLDVTAQLQDSFAMEVLSSLPKGKLLDFLSGCTSFNRSKGLNVSSLMNDAMGAAVIIYPELAEYKSGAAIIHPNNTGIAMMSYLEANNGHIMAASSYDFDSYTHLVISLLHKLE